jgi:hypothetical protein
LIAAANEKATIHPFQSGVFLQKANVLGILKAMLKLLRSLERQTSGPIHHAGMVLTPVRQMRFPI